MLQNLRQKAGLLKQEIRALYLAYHDPRVPLIAKALIIVIVGYALSPIDLIPDIIPVLGQLDDLILLPLGIALVLRLIPAEVMADCRAQAEKDLSENQSLSRAAAIVIVALWMIAILLLIRALLG